MGALILYFWQNALFSAPELKSSIRDGAAFYLPDESDNSSDGSAVSLRRWRLHKMMVGVVHAE